MHRVTNFAAANEALQPYVPLVAQLTGKDTTLERIRPLMDLLGNPQEHIATVHIAGTSGKTSTAYFTAGLLRAAVQRVGLTVSPHVDSIAERVQIDGVPLAEGEFCSLLAEFLGLIEGVPQKPSYFELLYAFSLWVFRKYEVDYAVVETGMGGLYDATNVVTRADKLCIITDIGLDHMHILGDTVEKIAAQKAGIIHEHNPVIMYQQAPNIMSVFTEWAKQYQAVLYLCDEQSEAAQYDDAFLENLPDYQLRNWLLAYRAYRFLAQRDGLPALRHEQLQGTRAIQVPGRMDTRTVGSKTIIMDGAHNEQKMEAFLRSFQHTFPGVKPAMLLALKQGKEIHDLGPLFAPLAARIIVTTFSTSQDLPVRSVDPAVLVDVLQKAGIADVKAVPDQREAYAELLAGPEPVIVITGSFYLLSQLRAVEGLR